MMDESSSTARRTIHGFVDWVEAAKAMAWTIGAVTMVLWAGTTAVLDNRYAKVSDIKEFRCEYKSSQISSLEMQVDIIDAKLRRIESANPTAAAERLQLLDEKQIVSRQIQQMKRTAAVENGCPISLREDNTGGGI